MLCCLNPDVAKVKMTGCQNGDGTLHLFGICKECQGSSSFCCFWEKGSKEVWDRFRCLGVRFVLVFWQTMRSTGWTPFQIAIGFFWANFTYPGHGHLQQQKIFIRKTQGVFRGVRVLMIGRIVVANRSVKTSPGKQGGGTLFVLNRQALC